MEQFETPTGAFREILYGSYRPGDVLERYETADSDLCHLLHSFPIAPADYLDTHKSIRSRWSTVLNGNLSELNEWHPPFYALQSNPQTAFHILCDFYDAFIRAECRMLIETAEIWKQELAISTLTFELITIRDELLDGIKECSRRSNRPNSDSASTSNSDIDLDIDTKSLLTNLESYTVNRLKIYLMMTLFELQGRFSHLFEDRIISKRELFLKYLHLPVPQKFPWHRTTRLTEFELEKALRSPDTLEELSTVKKLLKEVRTEYTTKGDSVRDSIHLLENCWLLLFLSMDLKEWGHIDLNNPAAVSHKLQELHSILRDNSSIEDNSAETRALHHLITHHEEVTDVLCTVETGNPSDATRLTRLLGGFFDNNHVGDTKPVAYSAQPSMVQDKTGNSILDQYLPVDHLQEKLGVTDKTVRDYLRKSDTPVISFSAKTRLIHITDFEALMDHFKKPL